eukprot:gene15384-20745_t
MNVVKEIERINAEELKLGIIGGISKGSWHDKYESSAWVFIGGLSFELTEGDIICVMSQWGEVEDINLVREKGNNKSKGFAFLKYEDQRSTILAVDNMNGTKLLDRLLRVDHVDHYKLPKEIREKEEELLNENPNIEIKIGPGHAYQSKELANEHDINQGVNLWKKIEQKDIQYKIKSDKSSKKKSSKSKEDKKKKEKKSEHNKKTTESQHIIPVEDENDVDFVLPFKGNNQFSEAAQHPPTQLMPIAYEGNENGGAISSWRGNKDPAIQNNSIYQNSKFGSNKRPSIESNGEEYRKNKKSEFDGSFGGINRIR